MDYNYKKRDYLLPEGCKDLIDVLKPKAHPEVAASHMPTPLPPIIGELPVAETMSVHELADVLKKRPFRIIADLMEVGIFATVHERVRFEIIARVIRKYGLTARKVV